MKSAKDKPLPEDVRRLIEAEEDAALARFRSDDFAGRVAKAVTANGDRASARAGAHRIPRWAWAAAAVFGLAAIVAYLAFPKRGPSPFEPGTARAASVRLPGLDGLDAWARDAALEPAPLSPAAGGFAAVLAGLTTRARATDAVEPASMAPAPRLGLEKLMEILIRDRAVEKALSLASPKFKEG